MASLWEALKQYVSDVAPGGVLSPETPRLGSLLDYGKQKAQYIGGLLDPNSQVSQDVGSWHKKTQLGLADLLAGKETPAADYGYGQMMNMAGVAPIGMTAWHGSPHKFDKFSLDKIGTGEGAQAYGHGLYLAEAPEVAQAYANKLTTVNGQAVSDQLDGRVRYLNMLKQQAADGDVNAAKNVPVIEKSIAELKNQGSLYKTDIPDEAVARFLDWDKPLSQDSPQAFKDAFNKLHETYPALKEQFFQAFRDKRPGSHYYSLLNDYAKTGDLVKNQTFATNAMRDAGIPGIRYLDGGSRSAGQGSSNFVAFDPEMIRILERNGQPTGQQPWKPGEWQGLLGR